MGFIKLEQLNSFQREWLIERFAIRRPIVEVKQQFCQLFDGNQLRGEDLLSFKEVFAAEIEKKAKQELNNVNAVGLAFARVRLEELQDALAIAKQGELKTKRVSIEGTDKQGNTKYYDGWEEYREVNPDKIRSLIETAQKEAFISEKIKLEMIAKGYLDMKREAGIQPVQVKLRGDSSADNSPIVEATILRIED